jgi:hypothetical protein
MITHPGSPRRANLRLADFHACPGRGGGIDGALFLHQGDRSGVDEISLLTPCGTSDILIGLINQDSTLRCI